MKKQLKHIYIQVDYIKILLKSDALQSEKQLWELLPIYFGIFHHFGYVEFIDNSDISILLPFDPYKASIKPTDNYMEDDFFEQFEVVKYYEAWLSTH